MFAHTIFLLTSFVCVASPMERCSPGSGNLSPCATVVGGPPSVRIADRATGEITRGEWATAAGVTLAGCVPDPQVVSLVVCIKDCTGKDERLSCKGATFLPTMKTMVANLPIGTPFTVTVKVVDGKGKEWPVSPGNFVWRG